MTCADALEAIEAIAAGDLALDGEIAAHVAGCRSCAAALDLATRIERALVALPAASAPPRFTQEVAAAVRRERWRSEERVDRAFNVTIAAGLGLVGAALVSLFYVGSLAQMVLAVADTLARAAQEPPAWQPSGSLPILWMMAAAAAMAVGVWWWLERSPRFDDESV